MGKEWYADLPDDDARFYEEAVNRIKKGIEQEMTFEQAASLVESEDEKLKAAIVDDTLKLLLAEMHFVKKQTIEEVAKKLRLPLGAVSKARQEMIESVEDAAIEAYKREHGEPGQGNA